MMEAKLFKPNWWHVLTRAWSSWVLIAASILTGLEVAAVMAWEHGLLDLPAGVFPAIMLFLTMLALFARLLAQRGF